MFIQNRTLMLTILFMTILLFTNYGYGQLPSNVDEGSIGIGLNQLPGAPVSWSVNAAVPYGKDTGLNGFAAVLAQNNGTVTRGRFHAEVGKNFGAIRGEVYVDGTFINQGDGFGRDVQTGANAVVDTGTLEIKIGLAGKSGGAMAQPNLFDLAAANGYDENYLEKVTHEDGKTLSQINPAKTGLSFQNRNSIVLRIGTEFDLPYGISAEGVAMPELHGVSDEADSEPLDQLIVTLNKSYAVSRSFSINAGADIAFQRFRTSGTTESAVATRVSANFLF